MNIMKTVFFPLLACNLWAINSVVAQNARPNIIMFLVDDMGWQDTSVPFNGNEVSTLNLRYQTPNMERLARLGVKFTQAYSCAISSPTRCSLMSGMNASRHRVTNWTLEFDQKTDANSDVIELPDWNYNGIQPEATKGVINNSVAITSLPQILKDNGYRTIHCGKAHFGARTTPGADPSNMGFDINIAGGPNGAPGSYLGIKNFGEGSPFAVKGLEKYHGQDIFLTEALTIEAIKEMKKAVNEKIPFYLYMSHYAVHTPIEDDKRFSNNYRGKYDRQLKSKLGEKEAKYAALVEGMDKSLGDIMDYIQSDPKLAQNTIILFMSDNGGQALGYCREGVPNRDPNYPARAGKGSAFMGGVREPMLVYWPGVTKPGSICLQKVIIEDFYPSIIEMAGIHDYHTVQIVDGKSFVRCLKNVSDIDSNKSIVWHFPNLWGETQDIEEGYGAYSSILKGDYHLIYNWENGRFRLYNVKDDLSEQIDLSERLPEIVKKLSSELSDYLRERNAQRPSLKSDGKILPYPDGL
ncbi:sulfatase [Bacteroides mediterraneensis]|uniref:sulfatase n=1 Tax=Bacteroides mediterraneensis TaxID=1841856 RepID=UPI0009354AEC|nr:sulfatase [Bacteroides mediterraneensis]